MTSAAQSQAVRTVDVIRRGQLATSSDDVAVELPLEVRVNGEPLAIIMRTPGADRELSLGFLFSEGIVRSRDDVRRVDVDESAGFCNVLFVRGRDEAIAEALSERRQVTTNSSCGLCGRRTLASLDIAAPVCSSEWSIEASAVARFPEALKAAQPAFGLTGGLHAAGFFDLAGEPEATAEDIGRHNAVDKLVGRMLEAARLPASRSVLFVSGRASFEIVQKAWLAGIPVVAAVSAPSSLAIDLAIKAGITLAGFVRDGRFNLYAHASRVRT